MHPHSSRHSFRACLVGCNRITPLFPSVSITDIGGNSHSEFEAAIRDSPPIPNFIFPFLPSSSPDVSQFFPFQISTSSPGTVISIPLLSCFPHIAILSGVVLHLVINCAAILRNTLSVSLVTGLFILLNNAVPQSQRGAANAISITAMSVFKAFGPAGRGAL
ncbi:probable peptide/nitrate transporter At3g43790 isoform X1 [Gossypium raimondii]|uniref:Uncharacterized protein n=1 Tax=Gossypium raimondii TaxID=29730 RepID=A0A0D2SWC0_GOSRA|nr:probable peptide/nitrate transporter At3g43790 isoform X1 [Gossypium raimondii]KJB35640.1 hypothetical protein B456_006G122900 [Gossypium raimondii]